MMTANAPQGADTAHKTMADDLRQIFLMVPDILSPEDFIGAAFTAETSKGVFSYEITDIRMGGENRNIAMATIRSLSGQSVEQSFPGHDIFREADWDSQDLNDKIDRALVECRNRLIESERLKLEERSRAERQSAAASLKVAARLGGRFVDIQPEDALAAILALEVLFDDIVTNESEDTCEFVAGRVGQARYWGSNIRLTDPQKKYIQDVSGRVVRRHRARHPA